MTRSLILTVALLVGSSNVVAAGEIQRVIFGSTTLYIPKAWIRSDRFTFYLAGESGGTHDPSDDDYHVRAMDMSIGGLRADLRRVVEPSLLPGRLTLGIPDKTAMQATIAGILIDMDKQRSAQKSDEDGFWSWESQGYLLGGGHVLLGSGDGRPFGYPLVVTCNPGAAKADPESFVPPCNVGFFVSEELSGSYEFDVRRLPKSKWRQMDKEVRALLTYLMTPKGSS